jgi:hypothetical protein
MLLSKRKFSLSKERNAKMILLAGITKLSAPFGFQFRQINFVSLSLSYGKLVFHFSRLDRKFSLQSLPPSARHQINNGRRIYFDSSFSSMIWVLAEAFSPSRKSFSLKLSRGLES